jgi:L-rhamnose mutarotase
MYDKIVIWPDFISEIRDCNVVNYKFFLTSKIGNIQLPIFNILFCILLYIVYNIRNIYYYIVILCTILYIVNLK